MARLGTASAARCLAVSGLRPFRDAGVVGEEDQGRKPPVSHCQVGSPNPNRQFGSRSSVGLQRSGIFDLVVVLRPVEADGASGSACCDRARFVVSM